MTAKYLRRRDLLEASDDDPVDGVAALAASTGSSYRPWAQLLRRTFEIDVLRCDRCQGRMRLVALVVEDKSIARFLRALGEPTSLPPRAPARGPPYWQSRVLRRASGNDEAA